MVSGLSHNSVLCITQTNDGYVWMGTRDGLCRFNGNGFTVFKQNFDNSTSLSNNSINCLYESSNGELWVGTTMGLNRYSKAGNDFKQFIVKADSNSISHNYIKCIIETIDNKFLVGSPSGVDIYDPGSERFSKILCSPNPRDRENNITCFLKDENSGILIGTRSGLFKFQSNSIEKILTDKNVNFDFEGVEIRDIKQDADGRLWIATEEKGLFVCTLVSGKITDIRNFDTKNSLIVSNHVRKLLIANNEVWIGTMEGLSIYNKNTGKFSNYKYSPGQTDGLSNNSIRDLFSDNQGGIWIATYAGGVNYYHAQNNLFEYIKISGNRSNLSSTDVVSGFLEENNGNLWIATEGGGLIFNDISNQTPIYYTSGTEKNSIAHNNVKSMAHDINGNLWIATYNGLSYFDKNRKAFTNFFNEPGNNNSLANNQIHSLIKGNNDILWIGTNGNGLQIYDQKQKQFKIIDQIKARNINVLLAGSQNRIWVGHQGGLECINQLNFETTDISNYLNQLPFTIQYVQSLFEDNSGNLWIGTQGFGLFLMQNRKMVWFNTEKGLPDNTINAITEDDSGNLWISSNKGISKIRLNESDKSIRVKTYSKTHGLQGDQFYPMSVLKSKNGDLYFGGINGYNKFNPRKIFDFDFNPEVVITGFSIRPNKKESKFINLPVNLFINTSYKNELHYSNRDITIDFTGLNYINPENTFYRYQLGKRGKEWVNLGNQHTLNFNFLPPGKYELNIQASTNPEKWGDKYKQIHFIVLPPWWLTIWAIIGYIVLVLLLLFVFFQLSNRWSNLNNQLRMEHFQREKEEELHQLKLKFFTDVSHELRTPLSLIIAPLEQIINQPDINSRLKNQLMLIKQNSTRMMNLINKVLDLRRLDSGYNKLQAGPGNLAKFMKETSLAFGQSAGIKQIEFEFKSDSEIPDIYFDREKLEVILYNLLSNALKNTPSGGKITLELKKAEEKSISKISENANITNWVAIIVTDNGKGISPDVLPRIFERFYISVENGQGIDSGIGLELTKRLVELHHGTIFCESRLKEPDHDGFTSFTVLLPVGKTHLKDDEIVTQKSSVAGIQFAEMLSDEIKSEEEVEWQSKSIPNEKKSNDQAEKLKLLVIEDNTEVRDFIADLFADQYSVEKADNGQSGLEMACDIIPDIIICDIMMPGLDGLEVCKRIKTDLRTCHIPVILLTARTALTFRYQGLETGADDYITKPFSSNYLVLRVKNLLHQRQVIRDHFNREAICDPAKITVTSVDEKLLKKAVDFIGEHMTDPKLSVERLSDELGLSRVHLYRKIKSLTNLTAIEFIRSIRLKRAAWLLQENKLNVNEICAMVGFDDPDYFRSCFKQQFGIAPSEYSRKFKSNNSHTT